MGIRLARGLSKTKSQTLLMRLLLYIRTIEANPREIHLMRNGGLMMMRIHFLGGDEPMIELETSAGWKPKYQGKEVILRLERARFHLSL